MQMLISFRLIALKLTIITNKLSYLVQKLLYSVVYMEIMITFVPYTNRNKKEDEINTERRRDNELFLG